MKRGSSTAHGTRIGLAAGIVWLLAVPASALQLELRSAVAVSGCTQGPDDCRDTTPRSCRGRLHVDGGSVPLSGSHIAFSVENDDFVGYGDVWVRIEDLDDESDPGLVRIASDQADSTSGPGDAWTAGYRIGAAW